MNYNPCRGPLNGVRPEYRFIDVPVGNVEVTLTIGGNYQIVGHNTCPPNQQGACHANVNKEIPGQLIGRPGPTNFPVREGEFLDIWWGVSPIAAQPPPPPPPPTPPPPPPDTGDEPIWIPTASDQWTNCPPGYLMDGGHVGFNDGGNGKWLKEFRCIRVPGSGANYEEVSRNNQNFWCPVGKAIHGVFLFSANDNVKYVNRVSCVDAPMIDEPRGKGFVDDERTVADSGFVAAWMTTVPYDTGGGNGDGIDPSEACSIFPPGQCPYSLNTSGSNSVLATGPLGASDALAIPFIPDFPNPLDPCSLLPPLPPGAPDPFGCNDDDDKGPDDRVLVSMETYRLQSSASTASAARVTSVTGGCNFQRDLEQGSDGEDVRCLQRYLNGAGYLVAQTGDGSPGLESPFYGDKTKNAVGRWQDANGVSVGQYRGYFGPASRAKYTQLTGLTQKPSEGSAVSANVLEGVQESLDHVREYLDNL